MKPYYTDDAVTLYHSDALDLLRSLPSESIDACVTDPPYGLADHAPATIAQALQAWVSGDREHVPNGKGFMGREWDRFVPPPAVWDECLRVLKPGGHLLAFAGARTQDLMAMSIRLAGFEIRDGIDWIRGQAFPKSLDVSKAIDKAAGAERALIGIGKAGSSSLERMRRVEMGYRQTLTNVTPEAYPITAPASEDARRWSGWGTALKPAREPVVWAQKPLNPVPVDWRLVAHVHHALAGLLWLSLSPAKRAELGSRSRNPEPHEAWCVSARVSAVLATSPDESAVTGTYSSPALASTCSNIVRSWNAILAALSAPTSMFTTSTASSTTTALRTLNSLLAPITSPTTMPACGCLHGGLSSAAESAASGSSDAWARWTATLSRSVPETATEGIALAASSALASIAADLLSDPGAESSADPTATTRAAGRVSPAREPIVVARKPLSGTVAANVLAHGTGALNIDACRTEGRDRTDYGLATATRTQGTTYGAPTAVADFDSSKGRWPTNVVLSHAATPDGIHLCGNECVDGCPVAELDRQSGATASRVGRPRAGASGNGWGMTATGAEYDDAGGASRFFPVFRYEAKAPTAQRPTYWTHSCECEDPWPTPTTSHERATAATTAPADSSTSRSGNDTTAAPSPTGTMSTTATTTSSTTTRRTSNSSPRLSTSGSTPAANPATVNGGSPAASAAPSSPLLPSTGISAERDGRSTAVAGPVISPRWSATSACGRCGAPPRREAHATVKPLPLLRWLVRLVTPPGGVVLEPFAGSGTTAEACVLEGFRCIAVEREAAYLPLITARLTKPLQPALDIFGGVA